MPCAAGELCQLSDSTTTPEFFCCGPCGGRLHRICGDPDDDEEVNRICEPCAAAKKSTSSTNDHSNAAKRKEGGGILQQSAPKKRKGETRKRLTLGQKREILQLLDQKVSRVEVARRFNCGVSTVGVVLQEMMSLCVPLNGWCCHAMDLVMNNDKHFMLLELFQSSALLLVHLKHCCRN